MRGKISDFSIPEIFQLVANQGKSGSLLIKGEDRETVFIFADGRITEVVPDQRNPSELLGAMLVDAGILTEEELKRLLTRQAKAGKKLGEILVEKGTVSADTLYRYLHLQIKESLFATLKLKEGEYRFEGFAVRPPPWIKAPIRADVLMMEGMQYLDEYPIYRVKFPAGTFRVVKRKHEKIDPKALPAEEKILWQAIDFSDDPRRVFRKACLTWFEGIKGLWSLLDRGLIEVSPAEETRVDPRAALRGEIVRRRRNARVRTVLWAVAAALLAARLAAALAAPGNSGAFAGWAGLF